VIFGVNTTCDISKLSQISKYHSWYLCQTSLQIMLLPIQIPSQKKFKLGKQNVTSSSGQHNDPGVSHTFSRRFLKQNYPKYICDIVGVRKKTTQLSDLLSKLVIFLKFGFL